MSDEIKMGERIKELRKFFNFSQARFADNLKISQGFLSDVEKDKKIPGSSFLLSLLKYYGVNINWLLTGRGEMFLKEDIYISEEERENLKDNIYKRAHLSPDLKEMVIEAAHLAVDRALKKLLNYKTRFVLEDKNTYPLIEGKVACGNPSVITRDEVIDYIFLPESWNIRADFAIKTRGTSMLEYGIFPDMLCFIKKQPVAENGDIAAICVWENEENHLLLKKVKVLSENIRVFQNGRGDIMEIDENVSIIGIVTFWMTDPGPGNSF